MAKILIVEDDPTTSELLRTYLGSAGHECFMETSGSRVLDLARNSPPDVVVLDVMLPGVSGFELCRRIRRDSGLFMMPILILSAMSSEEEVLHGLSQGADDYITKPFDIQNLVQRVEALARTRADVNTPDALTSLPGADHTKRELQRRISRQDPFAAAYLELTQIREFTYRCGAEARGKVIRWLGRVLLQCGEELRIPDLLAGHMGGGHFVCVLPLDACEHYCNGVRKMWTGNLARMYSSLGLEREYQVTQTSAVEAKRFPLLDILCCLARCDNTDSLTSKQVFEVLSHIRHRALETGSAGIHHDRRRTATE